MSSSVSKRFIGINLMPGVNGWNMSSYFLACCIGIMLATFVPGMQPYLLTEFLKIPEAEQGRVTGQISFIGEVALLVSVGFWGPLSDKIGRKPVLAAAFVLVAAACYFFPRSYTYAELAFARILFSCGFAAYSCIVVVLIAEYARADSRGKAMGIHGFANGLGALISVFVLLRLPKKLQDQGADVLSAGTDVYTLVMWVCLAVVAVILVGFVETNKDSAARSDRMLEIIRKGLRAAQGSGGVAVLRRRVRLARQPHRGRRLPDAVAGATRHPGTGHEHRGRLRPGRHHLRDRQYPGPYRRARVRRPDRQD